VPQLMTDLTTLQAFRRLNQTTAPFPSESSVKELFEACAARRPDSVAVVQDDRCMSYHDLNQRANALATELRHRGLGLGDVASVCVDRSPELVVTLVAILKCGAAYLPFDSGWPDERIAGLLNDANCKRLLTDRPETLAARFPTCDVIPVTQAAPDGDIPNPDLLVPPTAIAYINFTSGSTGRPKGVPIQHRSIARLVFGARFAPLDQTARLLHLAPVSFDAATFELWGALLHGGTCVLYPPRFVRLSELKRVIDEHAISALFLTSALFNTVVDDAPDTLDQVRTILVGGEALSPKHIRRGLDRYGPGRLVNGYGPTECTTFATYYPIREVGAEEISLPIGRPIQNTRVYVVDGDRLCPPGQTGELLIGGPGLSPGYLAAPDITHDRFAEYEIDGRQERLYRTGDLAYLRADGELVFQGRRDSQVKVNGFRIELAEISHHLDKHPQVRQSYVTTVENATGETTLLAFVVLSHDSGTTAAIQSFLKTKLPGYMIPRLCPRQALPLSPTGKVDHATLLSTQS